MPHLIMLIFILLVSFGSFVAMVFGFANGDTDTGVRMSFLFGASTLFWFARMLDFVTVFPKEQTEDRAKAGEFVLHAVLCYVMFLVVVGSPIVWWCSVQDQAAKKEAAMPAWHTAAGTTLSETLESWKAKAGFHDVYPATGSIDTKAPTNLDVHAEDFCGAVEKLAKRLKVPGDVKFGSSCKAKEGVAMIYAMTKTRDADRTVRTVTGACATYKPRYGTISIDKNGACQTSPSHAGN